MSVMLNYMHSWARKGTCKGESANISPKDPNSVF